MIRADLPVKMGGKSYRLITDGDTAGLFGRAGLEQRLVVVDDKNGRGIPTVTNEAGDPVSLSRTSRPCSCKGAPWKTSLSDLRGQL